MDRTSRLWFGAVGAILILLASGLVLAGMYQVGASLWRSGEDAAAYAYGQPDAGHPSAITEDRRKPFHHQSAFIRFRPYASEGRLDGRNPVAEAWLTAA